MKMTMKEAIARQAAARSAYASAAKAFRASCAELGALDQMLASRGLDGCPGFGSPPDITSLRHAIALSEESGSIGADINAIIASTQIEG
jgi:hypothetical protein